MLSTSPPLLPTSPPPPYILPFTTPTISAQIHLSGRKHALAVRLLNGNADETWPCNICHLPFDSALTLTEHNLSKEHATQASRWLTKLGTNAHMAERERHEPWRCYMCDVMCTGQINLQVSPSSPTSLPPPSQEPP